MKTLGDEKACGKIKSGLTKYCTKVCGKTHVSSRGTKASKSPRAKSSKGMFALLGF
jgi:transposase-like protein